MNPEKESEAESDFFSRYLEYTDGTEVPPFFHRWAAISGLGAWLGRRIYLQHGQFKVYPNLYCMLLGVPGTRKSTAIKSIKNLLKQAGYNSFSAEKTSKEKFLMDLAGVNNDGDSDKDFLDTPFADQEGDREVFIAADEFNDFFGNNILEFVSLLGVLWDWEGAYENRIKNGMSITINNPTVSILGGNTQTTFATTFPPEVIGQGFFSRLIPVYAEATGLRITFPKTPDSESTERLLAYLNKIRESCVGQVGLSPEAIKLLDKIYKTWQPLEDIRFAHYGNRRLNHLMRLVLIHTAARCSMTVEARDVQYANTILHHTEHYMPKAFGAFGQAKNSMLTYKVLQIIENSAITKPLGITQLWTLVQSEAASIDELGDVIKNLLSADKIQNDKGVFLPKRKILEERHDDCVNYNLLTDKERSYV